MKKTTWAIIGLSLTVLILATALGVVLFQKRTETSIVRASEDESSSTMSSEVQQIIDSFHISPCIPADYAYIPNAKAFIESESLKIGSVVYHNNQMYGVPGVPGKGIRVYRMGKGTTYVISSEK